MNTFKSLGLAGVAVTTLFAAQAFATTCPTAPATGVQTQGSPVCIAPEGLDGPGKGLQDQLNDMTKAGTPQINVYTDQKQPSAEWSVNGSSGNFNKIVLELAGNANSNAFGIFDPTKPSNTLQLFSGPASAGWSTTLINNGGGSFTAIAFDPATNQTVVTNATFGVNNKFGYYLSGPGGTFYSVPGMNKDPGSESAYPNGMPHMVAYQGNGKTVLVTPNGKGGSASGVFDTGEFLLAWEDLPFATSDLDYNDFVVIVESVHPVPEPAALGMFGLGVLLIGGFVALRRRQSLNA